MTNNQTIDGVLVPRELAKRLAVPMLRTPEYLFDHRDALDELRALLDAPTELSEIDLTPKRLEHAENVIEQQSNLIVSLRAELVESYRVAAQPQGAPVAWLIQCQHSGLVEQAEPNDKSDKPEEWSDSFPVYREQPAPAGKGKDHEDI